MDLISDYVTELFLIILNVTRILGLLKCNNDLLVLILRKFWVNYLGIKCHDACNLHSQVHKNQTDKYGTKLTTTISNFPVYLKSSHNKNMWENVIELIWVSQSSCQVSGHFPWYSCISYTRKFEHKSKRHNPNRGKWKTWRSGWIFLEPQSLEPLQWKTIYKADTGLDFTCKWTEPWRSLLPYKGEKFILCLLQCHCTLLHCFG